MNAIQRPRSSKRLGELMVDEGLVSKDQLKIGLTEQQRSGDQLGRIMVNLGFISEAVLRDLLGEALGRESVELAQLVPDQEALELVDKALARRYGLVPIGFDKETRLLKVAMADIYNLIAIDRLRAHIDNRDKYRGKQIEIRPLLAGEIEIEDAIDQFYGYELSVDGILTEIETGEIDYDSLHSEAEGYSQPFVRLVDAILADAVKRGASDIHFEPEDGFLRIRYRIDGVLRQIRSLHKNYYAAVAVRLKVMAGMNIAETRAPQDGRMSLGIGGHQIDFRVSCLLTTHGENIVLRVLDRDKGIMQIADLGLPEDTGGTLKLMMARPEGLILVTGPTGSGKTTTLYSMLNFLNDETVNIMTLEDPVEYPMHMIRQCSVNEAAKIDFANGIRSMMRQDPDIILVGEIRDEETADMAFRAAMTGHQVYSTLHTNSAVGAIPRLLDIGVMADVMAGNVIGILAQRLVRKLCPYCKTPYQPSEDSVERLLLGEDASRMTLYRASGCARCDHQGYSGRLALMEVLRMTPELDELIFRRATRGEMLRTAVQGGFRPISEDGLRRVREGVTSLEEVSRVIDLTSRV